MAVILTILPLMALIWYGAQRQFERESMALEHEVQRLTAFITGDVNHLLEATRQILVAISEISRSTSPEAGNTVLANLTRQWPYYTSFGVINPMATMSHSNRFFGTVPDQADDQIFQRALESKNLVIGRFRAGTADGKDLLSIAYCVRETNDTSLSSVAFVVLDLGWLDSLLSEERVTGTKSLFPRDMILNILNRAGTILMRYPDKEKWTGKQLPDTTVLAEILKAGEGAADLKGVDGVSRFYAFQSVSAASDDILVCIGVSRDIALSAARRNMYLSLAGVSAVGFLLISLAWVGTGLFITKPVAALVEDTRRLGSGDLNARTGITSGPREIIHLAGAFDRMAEILQREAHSRERMQTKLADYDRQLRAMSVQATLAEEQERKQIAAGLHDKAGPLLATCFMKLGRALKLPASQEVSAALKENRELIDQAIGELRSLTFDLSSPVLYTLGLPAAVEELCRDTAKRHSLAIAFHDRGTPGDLSNERRIVLYRAARELLFNVVKHAEATRATVTCGGDVEEVFVSVTDNGVGFDASNAGHGFSRTGGFGLFNLRERVNHLGGRFAVESSRGAGTRVVVALPALPHVEQGEKEDDNANQSLSS